MAQTFELEGSLFSQAFEQAAIGMALVGMDGLWLKVNASLCHILGYTEQELLGMKFHMITHPDDLDAHFEGTSQLLEGRKGGYQLEKRYLHKQGNIVWVHLAITLFRDSEGKPSFFNVQTQDISDRKRTDQLLIQSEQHYKSLFLYNPNAIASSDPAGNFFAVNLAMETMFGYESHEFMRMTFDILIHPDDAASVRV